MRNFDYLKNIGDTELYQFCSAAEALQYTNPDLSAVSARKALEYVVRSIFTMKGIVIPERTTLMEMVDSEEFYEFIGDDDIMRAVHYVRKVGNNGAHNVTVTRRESFFCLLNIYNIVSAVLYKLRLIKVVIPFNDQLIPKGNGHSVVTPAVVTVTKSSPVVVKADMDAVADTTPVAHLDTGISEADTRKLFIDLMLKEAGWDVLDTKGAVQGSKACIEVEVQGMPSTSGIGYCDYVLFGSDGLPLAVVEAKRTSKSPTEGKHQAELYADCLEKRYGRRPVIYYTNGFETHIIDGLGYPPRPLYAFHTEQDLELMIQRRHRKDISDFSIKDHITDRHYQKHAIKTLCEDFNKKKRRGLLVMATGTGKTRVTISLVDVLARNGWVKNVLFLADRVSLVSQAHKNFVKLLPHMTTSILSVDKDPDSNARLTFSTYQTMINYIDTDEKAFSIGRFDLIVIDEAHRSIFGKYASILNYFDALFVGLTATPREEVDHSTYEMFQMEQGVPTAFYEYEEAVKDGYLVPCTVLKRGSLILDEGIRYDRLSRAEKEELEKVWKHEQALADAEEDGMDTADEFSAAAEGKQHYGNGQPRDIENREIFKYIFSINTIDQVLQDLMEHGLKVQSGERIGKSIVFAFNHKHALKIVERFHALYPEYGSEFCELIDNTVNYSQNLIENFEVRDKDPQIAVSVDMLDTGVDVPDVLNLVFFKKVRSFIKFTQMKGRGTRLSPDIFGPGKDKERFYAFDWCRNFEYFNGTKNQHQTTAEAAPLSQRLFSVRSLIAFHLQHQQYQEDQFCKELHDELKDGLKQQVKRLSDSHISVREHWKDVSHFKEDSAWEYISQADTATLCEVIAPLVAKNTEKENVKKFDLIMLHIELSQFEGEQNADRAVSSVRKIAYKLQEKGTIPEVKAKMGIIKEVVSETSWKKPALQWLEKVRRELRDLMINLKPADDDSFDVHVIDKVTDEGMAEDVIRSMSYRQSVLDYLAKNRDLPVIRKIKHMEQLTVKDIAELERILWEELGTKNDYNNYTRNMACGNNVAIFVRAMVGVDRPMAVKKFSDFISGNPLNADQEEFLMTIIAYVCENGDITKDTIVNEYPFDERLSVINPYTKQLADYIDTIHGVITPQTA